MTSPANRALEAAATAGWCRWTSAECGTVSGADAADLLSRLSTQDLSPLGTGRAVTTVFLTGEGRVRHRVLLQPVDGGLRAVSESVPGAVLADWLDRYTFAEDCRWLAEPAAAPLLVVGRRTGAVLEAAGLRGLEADGDCATRGGLVAARRAFGPLPSVLVTGPEEELAELAAALGPAGALALDEASLLQLRVECGVPAAGAELDGQRHLLEAGLRDDASFEKGCYTGQEVVARQDTYDKVVRRLVGLCFEGRPAAGEELASEEKKGCLVTSVAPEPALEGEAGTLCLGFVRSAHAAPGTPVRTASGLEGRVIELPSPRLRG